MSIRREIKVNFALAVVLFSPLLLLSAVTADPANINSSKKELKLSLEPKVVNEISDKEVNPSIMQPPEEILGAIANSTEKDSLVSTIEKIQVDIGNDGTPILGYKFLDKSEAAKRAESMRAIDGQDSLTAQDKGISGRFVDGEIR